MLSQASQNELMMKGSNNQPKATIGSLVILGHVVIFPEASHWSSVESNGERVPEDWHLNSGFTVVVD